MNITGIACGRCLLQAIQKYDLEEPIVWGLENPQAEDESGDHRLNDIIKYKCLYDTKIRLTAQGQNKISVLFGKSYFLISRLWLKIKKSIILPAFIYQEMFDYFIQNFENSLLYNMNDKNSEKNEKNSRNLLENSVNDSNLVWAINFFEVLKKRQDLRKIEAEKRCKNNDNDSDYANDDNGDDDDDNDDDDNGDDGNNKGNLKSEN